jgi:PAS domain S-box-containing protein
MGGRSWWRGEAGGYLVAVGATATAALIRLALDFALGDQAPFFTFVLAVLVAAWYGGARPGLLATALGAALGVGLFVRPLPSSWADAPRVALVAGLFLIVGATASWLCGALHAARRRTEDKQRQLEQAEEQIRSVVDHVLDAIITIDEGGTVRSINPAGERLFGYPASEIVGRNVKVLMPEPYSDEHDKYLANYLLTGEAKIIGVGRGVVGRREDGSTFPMELAVSEFRLGDRRYFTGIVRDVTERKRAEEEVRRLNAELRGRVDELQTILNVVPVGIALALDPACHRLALNPYLSELLGVPAGANASLSAPPDERPTSYSNYRDGKEVPPDELPMQVACTGVEVGGFEVDLVREGREARKLLCFARPLRDGEGRVRGSVGAFLDITELKKGEQALQEADRRKDEFVATLAHELRNPLAAIQNAVEILKRSGAGAAAKTLDMMDRQLGHLVRLIDDLLDVSRITRGKLHLRPERAALVSIVDAAVEVSRSLIDRQGHELTVEPVPDVHLDGDPIRLAQVIANLLTNAAKYTERGGRIVLAARREGGAVVVSVRDTGIGIPQAMLTKVFELFAQVDRGREKATGGLGIGLSLVKALVEMHGGSVEARSAGDGQGSEFVVRLPVPPDGAPDQPRPPVGATAPPTGGKLRVLVVDDDDDSAESMATMLEMFGHEVRAALGGEAGVREAEAFRPQVVLLDIGMPKVDGYEACRRIRAEPWGAGVVLIALTGWGADEDRRKTREAGFDHHLTKPVNPADLRKLLGDLHPTPLR